MKTLLEETEGLLKRLSIEADTFNDDINDKHRIITRKLLYELENLLDKIQEHNNEITK